MVTVQRLKSFNNIYHFLTPVSILNSKIYLKGIGENLSRFFYVFLKVCGRT